VTNAVKGLDGEVFDSPESIDWVPAIRMLAFHAYRAGAARTQRLHADAEREELAVDAIQTELIGRVQRGDCG